MSDSLELQAVTAFGLEAVAGRELAGLGFEKEQVSDGRVTFRGDEKAICRTNLWLRTAERVQIVIGRFPATDFGELFDRTYALPWERWLPPDASFPVTGRSVKSQLHSVPDCQRLVKKAIVNRLLHRHLRAELPETGPIYPVEVSLLKDEVTLTLDTTGAGLHKRGYRLEGGIAPLRETLAAALVQLSTWNPSRVLADPFCGTGTIAIEAALIARNIAPGLNRSFAAEAWGQIPLRYWSEARSEARQQRITGAIERIEASDNTADVLALGEKAAAAAGVGNDIRFRRREAREWSNDAQYGCVITNPPYGERLEDARRARKLMERFCRRLRMHETWSHHILMAEVDLEAAFGRKADRRRKLYNARIPCTYYQFWGPRPVGAE